LGGCVLGGGLMAAAIRFDDVTLGYDRHPAVHHLTGEIAEGSLTALVGPNGGGKSTLLKSIIGTLTPLSGTITLNAERHDIAYLPQAAEIDRSFPISVFDFVSTGLWTRLGIFGGVAPAERARIAGALDTLGLKGFERRPIGTLSGGQMQRALFARLLLQEAKIVLLDEPFTAIDEATVRDLIRLVARWQTEGRTVVTVLHDLDLARQHFPNAILLARECVGWGDTRKVLTPDNFHRASRLSTAPDPHADICERETV
jgi:zinc/manganese transport system ATP-binding protein